MSKASSEETALQVFSNNALEYAGTIAINTDGEYEEVIDFQKSLKEAKSRVGEYFDPMVKSAHKTHSLLVEKRKGFLQPINEAIGLASSACGGYLERKRVAHEEEQERKRELAREEARKLLEAEAARKAAEAVEPETPEEVEEIAAVIEETVEAAGQQVILQEAPPEPKVEGQRKTTSWKFEVVDPELVPREFLTVDTKAIGAFVRAKKAEASILGVRTWSEEKVTV